MRDTKSGNLMAWMKSWGMAMTVLTMVICLSHGNVSAASQDVSKEINEAVAKMSAEQQAALLLFLDKVSPAAVATDVAKETTPPSAKDALFAALDEFKTLSKGGNFNLAPFMARISENFTHPVVGDKEGVQNWIEGMSSMLFDDDKPLIEFSLEDVEVEVDGTEASAYPIDIDTPIGSVTVEVIAELESDGVWRMVAIDGL